MAIIGSEEQWPQIARIEPRSAVRHSVPADPRRRRLPLPVHYHIHYGSPIDLRALGSGSELNAHSVAHAAAVTRAAVEALIAQALAQRRGDLPVSEDAARRVLLTGATTPVGHAIVQALSGDPVVQALVCVYGPSDEAPPRALPHVHYVQADLTSYRSVRDLVFGEAARGIDTIVHAALHRDPLATGEHVHRLNVASTRQLLAAAEEQLSIRRFVLRSFASVYRLDSDEPVLIDEDHALDMSERAPDGLRSRVEADFTVCAKIGGHRLQIAVLRCAEILAAHSGSPLYDYLSSRVCLRPLGYDPMVNVLSLSDTARAVQLAALSAATGIFNIPGRDTLPLSELIYRAGRQGLALPGPVLQPLYALRAAATLGRFRYPLDEMRFHYGAVLDGRKAAQAFAYAPEHAVAFDALFAPRDEG